MKLSPRQKKLFRKIATQNDLQFIILYGSYATGKNKKDSDLDIAVLQNQNSQKKLQFLEIFEPLQKIFPKFDLDLSFLDKNDTLFLYEVTANSQLLYGNSDEYLEFKSYAFRRYFDESDLFKLKDKLLKKQQKLLTAKIHA